MHPNSEMLPELKKRIKDIPKGSTPSMMHILYLYAGDPGRPGGIPDILRKKGHMITAMDLKGGQDLIDDALWCKIHSGIGRVYDFVLMSPPCGSFSHARGQGCGPRILRSRTEVLGIKNLSPAPTVAESDMLKTGNYHNTQCLKTAIICRTRSVGFAIECPAIVWDDQVSMLMLPHAKELDKLTDIADIKGDQCMHGADSTKPTNFKVYTKGCIDDWRIALELHCNHPATLHPMSDTRGNVWKAWRSHPKLVGMKAPDGTWLTSGAETYPALLNETLVDLMLKSGIATAASADTGH
jgi:hypothetical protein